MRESPSKGPFGRVRFEIAAVLGESCQAQFAQPGASNVPRFQVYAANY